MPLARQSWPTTILQLTRAKVTCAVVLTTATGYLLAAGYATVNIWPPLVGVFLLACGSSALNQCQEARIDALMERTQHRPIPAGRVDRGTAFFLAGLFILLGLSVLTSSTDKPMVLLLLGGSAVVWYNGVYTYLKRVTPFAVVPGALIGAIPPVIGYVAAGGDPTDSLILLVASFFFIWQIPHFWLLMLMLGEQYDRAGLPTLTRVFSTAQIARITFMWILATAAAGLVFPALARANMTMPWSLAMVIVSLWLAAKAAAVLKPAPDQADKSQFRRAFVQINAYALLVMLCLSLSALRG